MSTFPYRPSQYHRLASNPPPFATIEPDHPPVLAPAEQAVLLALTQPGTVLRAGPAFKSPYLRRSLPGGRTRCLRLVPTPLWQGLVNRGLLRLEAADAGTETYTLTAAGRDVSGLNDWDYR